MQTIARLLIIFGVILALVGTIFLFFPRMPFGKLPGDIALKNKNGIFIFPIVTSIILSVVLTVIINLIFRR